VKLRSVDVLGGGPGGLYVARLLKLRYPDSRVRVFEQSEPVAAGAEVPVEDGEIDGVFVGQPEGGPGVRGGEHVDVRQRGQPLLERAADAVFIVADQDGVGHDPPCRSALFPAAL